MTEINEDASYILTKSYPNGRDLKVRLDIETVKPLSPQFYDKLQSLLTEDLRMPYDLNLFGSETETPEAFINRIKATYSKEEAEAYFKNQGVIKNYGRNK